MPSVTQTELDRRQQALDRREAELDRREVAMNDLARQLSTQHDRLRALRADLLQQLGGQRRPQPAPRWPSGAHIAATLIDEDDWWSKMLGNGASRSPVSSLQRS